MANVPHDGVASRVEGGEQGEGELDNAKGRRKMPAIGRDRANDSLTQFLRQCLLLLE
jgi:hypothetical protein